MCGQPLPPQHTCLPTACSIIVPFHRQVRGHRHAGGQPLEREEAGAHERARLAHLQVPDYGKWLLQDPVLSVVLSDDGLPRSPAFPLDACHRCLTCCAFHSQRRWPSFAFVNLPCPPLQGGLQHLLQGRGAPERAAAAQLGRSQPAQATQKGVAFFAC